MNTRENSPSRDEDPPVASSGSSDDGLRAGTSDLSDTLGRPMHDLRISLTDQCNFRCTYCMPEELFGEGHPFLPPASLLTFPEIEFLVRVMVPLGVRKIKITGGEPLLRLGVHTLIGALAQIPELEDIGLITNGFHLPVVAERLRRAGLRRLTISLDSVVAETFDRIVGRAGTLPRVLQGIEVARHAGFDPIKINMVVQRGVNDGEVVEMAEFARDRGLELRFIEYMDVGSRNSFHESLVVPNNEIRDRLEKLFGLLPLDPNYRGEVARVYEYADGAGRVGFISSMTQPFCRDCTRVRLSADGKLYRCLFSGIGLDLRKLLRDTGTSDSGATMTDSGATMTDSGATMTDSSSAAGEVSRAIRRFWSVRSDRYSEQRANREPVSGSSRAERLEMYRMGG